MHLVAETFYTLHLRKWEGAQMCNEFDGLLKLAGQDDAEAYPALGAFFAALQASAGDTDQAAIVDEEEVIPTDEADTYPYPPEDPPCQ